MIIEGFRSGWDPIFQRKFRKFELNNIGYFSKFFKILPILKIFLHIRIENDSFSRENKLGSDRAKNLENF